MEVEMDVSGVHHHQHQQEMSSQTLESMLVCTKAQQDKKPRPPEEALKCPRCDSSNTKFCYYNNYSLTQPRYFCKSCRRYWTKGGTLRNVPVGGGCRRNKRSSSATSSNSTSSSALTNIIRSQDHHHLIQQHHHQSSLNTITSNGNGNNPLLSHLPYDSTCTDLSLAFARLQGQASANGHMGYDRFDHNDHHSDQLGFLDAIRGGFLENTNTPNGFHNVLYNEGNLGNLMGLNNANGNHNHDLDQDQEMMNPMFNDHQGSPMMNNGNTCGTTAMTMATVKQETCNMMRSSEFGDNNRSGGGVLWGFPWQMGAGGGGGGVGDQGNMVHEVESGRSQIGGWNGIGSTNWHGLINSPLM